MFMQTTKILQLLYRIAFIRNDNIFTPQQDIYSRKGIRIAPSLLSCVE